MPRSLSLLAVTVLTAILAPSTTGAVATDPTVCISNQLDWYTDVVGETPCVTYRRLRQICNSDYQMGLFSSTTPGDKCSDQVSACCCNSISFALSMLCMNCQYDTATTPNGIDAGAGAYGLYLNGCSSISNKTLPANIQTAVCNKEIKIENDLYSLFWDTGAWFYVYTKETIEANFAATNNNTFTHCASTSTNDTTSATPTSITASTDTPTQTTAPSSASDSSSKSSNIGPIIGGVVGGVIGAAAVGVVLFFLLRKQRRNSGPKALDLSKEYYNEDASRPLDEPHVVTPYTEGSVVMSSRYDESNYSPSGDRETFNLIPRGPPGPGSAVTDSSYAYGGGGQQQAMSVFSGFDDERHEDGGPVAVLQRSNSGRLPPAYQSWEPAPPPPAPESSVGYGGGASEYTSQEGGSSVSGRSAGGSALRLVSAGRSAYPADVKRPLPES